MHLYAQQQSGASGRGLSAADFQLATAFAYWCLPQVFFYALYSLLGEVLNARKVFGPFTWAPVANNVIAIAGLVLFNVLFGAVQVKHAASTIWTPGMIALLAGSATLGVVGAGVLPRAVLAPGGPALPARVPLARGRASARSGGPRSGPS